MKREVAADAAADAAASAEAQARFERKKAAARERAKQSHRRKKAAQKARGAQTESAPGVDAAPSTPGPAPSEEGLAGVLGTEAPEDQPTPEELQAQQLLEQFGTPEKLAAFLARMQKLAEVAAGRSERAMRVVKALDWADDDGKPTTSCTMGVGLAWPWLEQGGIEFLAIMGPGFMAALGAGVLFAPAAIVAWDEYEAHKAERARLVNGGAASSSSSSAPNVTPLKGATA